ncbi:MAG TPA: electron transfer flavoprotein subunit beta/FixA family protein [Roseiflexaceae bacterium]|nr:electron transfer flavoprotein subunit beta/FixA family protein [Roseiflexaceae bacterium]
MHIIVCMKQVPRDNSVTVNPDLSVNAEGIEQIMNLFDEYAVEEALEWNEKLGGKVTVISLGPEEWKEQIRRALAMGATDALLLSDPSFANLDVLGAARAVAAAIQKLGDVDLVLCGRNSTDDESGAFGPALARVLGWPQLTYVGKVAELDEGGKRIVAERHLEEQIETVEAPLPAVVTVIKDLNEPRYPSLLRIKKVAKVEIPTWNAAELGLSATKPMVRVAGRVPPPPRPAGEIIAAPDAAAKVRTLVDKLLESQVI